MFAVQLITSRLAELLAVAWIIVAARQILFWLYFIQLKQYRLDRLWQAIKEPDFIRLLSSPFRLGVYGLFVVWIIFMRALQLRLPAFELLYGLTVFFYLVFALYQIWLYRKGRLKLPQMTAKIWGLFLLILSLETALLGLYSRFWPEQVLAIDIIQPLIVLGVFTLLWLPNQVYQRRLIATATAKRRQFQHLIVIGITGSYGKTTTKEYLAHILSSKYQVLKTPSHINVDTGIARLISSQLTKEHQMMIVEMGAYRPGEIKAICDMVQPQYGVLTALSNQHIELFGSQEAIERAKFELADAVKDPSRLFANADSSLLKEAFERRRLNPVWYAMYDKRAALLPEGVEYNNGKTLFTLNGQRFETNVFAIASLTNLMAAVAVASKLGMSLPEIAKAAQSLPVIERNMEMRKGKNGATYIDSSYNASTEGVRSSLRDLYVFGGFKKIAVFKEVIELGSDTERDHRLIASDMAEILDAVVLLPSGQREKMIETLLEYGYNSGQIHSLQTADQVGNMLDEKTVVLFMGRGSEAVLSRWKM